MEKTKIDWADYTWNPVIGCKNNCFYCYAKDWAKRFGTSFEPHKSKQWDKPYKIKEPSKIFVCSLADLFGDWVKKEWIEDVLKIVKDNRQHEFMFLTKNSKRYLEFSFPENCWLGVTITGKEKHSEIAYRFAVLHKKYKNKTFISFEPLLDKINIHNDVLAIIDLIIIGAMTGKHSMQPKKEWIDSIKHKNIIYKHNIDFKKLN